MIITKRDAVVSQCGTYRYALWRKWDSLFHDDLDKYAAFLCLNPSTADASVDDPTSRRCVAFADGFGYRRMAIVNLFAYRATQPSELRNPADPIGPEWWDHTLPILQNASAVIAAWGTNGALFNRDEDVINICKANDIDLQCLGYTASGYPRHPLYLPKHSILKPFKRD